MAEKLPDVWASRDYPVLRDVARRIDNGQFMPTREDVATSTGLSNHDVEMAGLALERRGLVRTGGHLGARVAWFEEVTGDAYLITGLHPSGDDALSSLVDALRQAADLEPDPAEKGRIKAAADSLLGLSRNVATGVVTAWLTHHVPGG